MLPTKTRRKETGELQIQRKGEWLSATIGEESAMMSIETGNYLTLSRVGTRIWELIEQPTTVSALCARLTEEFDVTAEHCRAEVDQFLTDLRDCQAITLSA
jgi:hypothetical protein